MNYILGLDIGTTHAKVLAMSSTGENLYSSKLSYVPVEGLIAGHHEFDPVIIRDAAVKLLLEAITVLKGKNVMGISISTAMHSLMLVDEKGLPLTNLITWADLRSAPQAKAIKEKGESISLYKKTGTPVHPMSPFCKMRNIRRSALPRMVNRFVEHCSDWSIWRIMPGAWRKRWGQLRQRPAGRFCVHSAAMPLVSKPLMRRWRKRLATVSPWAATPNGYSIITTSSPRLSLRLMSTCPAATTSYCQSSSLGPSRDCRVFTRSPWN